tara:strand:+ start:168 stop:737 length:570 start_codon:yes stop_codon:yes gene_type:complete
MFKELLLSSIIGFSVSVRTPNDETKPLDYEYSVKSEKNEGKFRYNLKRDWERELGEKYIDDVLHFQHQVLGNLYYGVDYVNKESKDIFYETLNLGWQHNSGFKIGLSAKHDEDYSYLVNLGYNKKFKQDDLEYIVALSIKSNLEDNVFNMKSEVKKWFTEKVNVFALYKHEYYNEKEDFQFKVGIGIKL